MVVSNYRSLLSYDYFDKLLRLENVKLFSRQDKIRYILDTTILILYRKLYINMVSIIVLNIEETQYNININLAISCSPSYQLEFDQRVWPRLHKAFFCTHPTKNHFDIMLLIFITTTRHQAFFLPSENKGKKDRKNWFALNSSVSCPAACAHAQKAQAAAAPSSRRRRGWRGDFGDPRFVN